MNDVIPFDPDEVGRSFGEAPPAPVAPSNGHARLEEEPPVPDKLEGLDTIAPRRRLYRLEELAQLTSAAEDYVVDGGIATRKGKVMIVGKSGIGKTTFLFDMLACLGARRPFLGRFAIDRPYRVLVIEPELTESELASHGQRLLRIFAGTPAAANVEFLLETQLRLPQDRAALRALVRDQRVNVLALDSVLEFFSGDSSDKPEQVRDLLSTFDWLLQEEADLDLVVIAHHENVAGGRAGGSWKWDAWPSTILRLEKVPGIATDRMVVFDKIRAPGFALPEKLQVRLSDHGYLQLAEEKLPEGRTDVIVQLLREAGGQLRRAELVERVATRTGKRERAAIGYVAQAKTEGAIAVHQVGREAVYRLADETAAAARVLHSSAQEATSA